MKKRIFMLALTACLAASAVTPRFAGYVGNSGEVDRPVTITPNADWQLRPYYDAARKRFHLSAGARAINVYSIDGRLLKTHGMPEGKFPPWRPHALTRAGDDLYFVRNGRLCKLPLDAPDGTPVKLANCTATNIHAIANRVWNDELVLFLKDDDRALMAWNVKTGRVRKLGRLDPFREKTSYLSGIDWGDDGNLYVFGSCYVYKIVDGKTSYEEGFPREIVAVPLTLYATMITGDAVYAASGYGQLIRIHPKTFAPYPGKVGLAGREISAGSGIVHLEGDYYAVGGQKGCLVILKWQEETQQFERVRCIGALPSALDLNVSDDGLVFADGMAFDWMAGESDCSVDGLVHSFRPTRSAFSGRDLVVVGVKFGQRATVIVRQAQGRKVEKMLPNGTTDFADCVGLSVGSRGRTLYVLRKNGTCFAYDFNVNLAAVSNKRKVELALSEKPRRLSGLVRLKEGGFALLADGRIVVLEEKDGGLRETGRLGPQFASDSELACDGRRLAVSEREKGKVTLLSLDGREEAALSVPSPGPLALNGRHLVVHDATGQRLLKYKLEE